MVRAHVALTYIYAHIHAACDPWSTWYRVIRAGRHLFFRLT